MDISTDNNNNNNDLSKPNEEKSNAIVCKEVPYFREFHLHTAERAKARAEFDKRIREKQEADERERAQRAIERREMELLVRQRLRKEMEFKANPIPLSHYMPPVPSLSRRPLLPD